MFSISNGLQREWTYTYVITTHNTMKRVKIDRYSDPKLRKQGKTLSEI